MLDIQDKERCSMANAPGGSAALLADWASCAELFLTIWCGVVVLVAIRTVRFAPFRPAGQLLVVMG